MISTKALNGNGSVEVYGKNQTYTFTQTGDNNQIRVGQHYSSDNQTSSTRQSNR